MHSSSKGRSCEMKLFFNLCAGILYFLDNGVSGVGSDVVSVSVMEGDSVIFHTGTETNQQEDIKWYFNDIRIAQVSGDLSHICTDVQCEDSDERFRDRLKLDHQTGSLTIMNSRTTDSGVYELKIISTTTSSERIFNVTINGVSSAERDKMQRKSVKEGETVTLHTRLIKNPNDLMTWYFNDILITEITGDQSKICADDQCDERLRDRLKVDHQTGSLTIMNIRTEHTGDYKLQISSFSISRVKRFNVTVIAVPDSGPSSAVVAGISIAVVVVVLLVVAAGVIYRHHHKKYKPAAQNENDFKNSPRNPKDIALSGTEHP